MLKTKEEITKWMDQYSVSIAKYHINDDLTVDADGSVRLGSADLSSLPVQFGIIKGHFDCSKNKLTSLKGCPYEVIGNFTCNDNQLTTLLYGPSKVGGNYFCHNNQLTSLEYSPLNISGNFHCSSNQLTSLEGGPISSGNYFCNFNKIISLRGAPRQISCSFSCKSNRLTSLANGPEYVGIDYDCGSNPIKDMTGFYTQVEKYFIHIDAQKIKEFENYYEENRLVLNSSKMRTILLAEKLNEKLDKNSPDKLRRKI